MAFKCPNCAGNLYYNITEKELQCEYCDSLFPLAKIPVPEFNEGPDLTNDPAQGNMPLVSFICKSCGAELLSPDESMLSYCSYCGSEAILEAKLTEEIKPKYILPFQQTKEQCKNIYRKRTEKMFFLPKDLKDSEYLERFRGTYIPYWMYKVDFPEPVTFEAKKKTTKNKQITETTYEVEAKVDGSFEGVPYDASSCFDDTISDMLMPFDKKKLKDFHPGYLAGFYADRADVPAEKYHVDAENRATQNAFDALSLSVRKSDKLDATIISKSEKKTLIKSEVIDNFTALFPIWFLTWRNKKRVAYAIVNGQNGRISCDLPVDMKSYSLSTIVTAAILFVLLTLFVSMTARTALMICSVLTVVALGLFKGEAREIRDRENHIFDKGYFVKGREVKMKEKKREKIREKKLFKSKKTLSTAVIMGGAFGAYVVWLFFNDVDISPSQKLLFVTFTCVIIGTIFAIQARSSLRYVREKSIRLFNFVAWAAVAASFFIAAWDPVSDIYYYFGCLACGLGAAIGSIGLIKYYNLLTTRQIPTFFDREGGRDNAKE